MNWLKRKFSWYRETKQMEEKRRMEPIEQDKKNDPNVTGFETIGDLLARGAHIGDSSVAIEDLPEVSHIPKYETPERAGCHVMVDIETWGTGPAAIPISIGAVKFYPDEKPFGWGEQFYSAIDPLSCAMVGLQLDVNTIMFWMAEDQRDALEEWLDQPKVDIHNVLSGFATWYGDHEYPTWCRGPDFDAVILNTAFKVIGMERPWSHQKNRDVRTIQGLLDWKWKPPGFDDVAGYKHNALADAIKQTFMLKGIIEALGLSLR